MLNKLKNHIPLIIFLVLYVAVLAFKLISHPTPFFDWDESIYIESGKEMLSKKYFLFPLWQNQVFLDKPPLIPLLYGIISKIFFFASPEVSTRIFTLGIATYGLTLIYQLYIKVLKSSFVTTAAVALTSITPIFLQRAQVVNLDIFLLVGWLGYLLFFDRFYLSLFFLVLALFSKSLLGFYPLGILGIYFTYLLVIKKIKANEYKKKIKKLFIHGIILISWFVCMYLVIGQDFWRLHIVESHFRRVTASIESHFGARTFFIDLAREQFGNFFWLALIGLALVVMKFFRKEYKESDILHALYLFPWFFFLNLTKTKIFWYFLPVIPQFAFLAVVPSTIFRKNKILTYALTSAILVFIFYSSFVKANVLAQEYSKPEPYYYAALEAGHSCSSLTVLVDGGTRNATKTLEELGLLITTTKWWGNHPSIVYYSGLHVDYIYTIDEMKQVVPKLRKGECALIEKEDANMIEKSNLAHLKNFSSFELFIQE